MNYISIIILFLFISNSIFGQNLTNQQYLEDLEFLKSELPKKHKNLYSKISETDFLSQVEKIEQKSNKLTRESFEIELYKLFKEIGDEHTKIEPLYSEIFPIGFDFFKEGIYVTTTDSINSKLLYKRLLGIENYTTNNLIKTFQNIIKTDNVSYFDVNFEHYINNPRILKGLNIIETDSVAYYNLDDGFYRINSKSVRDFSRNKSSNLLRFERLDNYWFTMIPKEQIIYFNYQKCQEEENQSFSYFNTELWNEIDEKKPKKIIIDLRNNGGGNSAILDTFLNNLSESYLNKKRKLYVLIGKNTFSSALMNAVDLKRNFNSILIGQPTSANVNHYGETLGFYLPNSRIIVGYSTKYWENWKGYNGPLLPDVEIEYSIENYKNGIDEAIEYILRKNYR